MAPESGLFFYANPHELGAFDQLKVGTLKGSTYGKVHLLYMEHLL